MNRIIPLRDGTELRLLQEQDAPRLFELTEAGRPYLREWLPWVDGTRKVEDSLRFVRMASRQMEENNGFHMGIWHGGELVGVIGYNYVSWPKRQTELGYWLGQAYQGQGLMTLACRGMINHAFDTMKLLRVEIHCAVGNQKSRAIPERLGFKKEGVRQQTEWLYTYFADSVVYSMAVDRWHELQSTEN